jgi:hypothetical protein
MTLVYPLCWRIIKRDIYNGRTGWVLVRLMSFRPIDEGTSKLLSSSSSQQPIYRHFNFWKRKHCNITLLNFLFK